MEIYKWIYRNTLCKKFIFNKFTNSVFALSIWCMECRMMGKKTNLRALHTPY